MRIRYIDLFKKIVDEGQKEIVIKGLGYNSDHFRSIRKTVSNVLKLPGYRTVSKVPFASHKAMAEPLLRHNLYGINETAKLLFQGYYLNKSDSAKIISDELIIKGYEIKEPDFEGESLDFNLLKDEDIFRIDNELSFFRPNCKKLENVSDEEATIMAILLGWSVTSSDSDEPISQETECENETEEDDFELRVNQLNQKFIATSELFLNIADKLIKGEIPDDFEGIEAVKNLENKFNELKQELDLPETCKINSIEELITKYKEVQATDQLFIQFNDKIFNVLETYKTIYHVKSESFPFFIELNALAKSYEQKITEGKEVVKEEWYQKFLGEKHFFNFLIKAVDHISTDDCDEDELDAILDDLEKECELNGFTFFKTLSRQINRGNLKFKDDETPLPPKKPVKKEKDKKKTKVIDIIQAEETSEKKPDNENQKVDIEKKSDTKENLEDTVKTIAEGFNEEIDTENSLSEEDQNILKLLKRDEPELAYHLALCYENEDKILFLPSSLLGNLFLSLKIRTNTGTITQKIGENFAFYDIEVEKTELGQFKNQLIFSTLLRPGIFGYNTSGAGFLLNEIYAGKMAEFSGLKKMISDFMSQYGGLFNFELLGQISDEAALEEKKKYYIEQIKLWLEKVQYSRYKNKPNHHYSRAYHNWIKEDGWIHQTLKEFLNKREGKILQNLLEEELEESVWRKKYDKELKNFVEKSKYLYGNNDAIRWITNQIDDLRELLSEGLKYYGELDTKTSDFRNESKILLEFVNSITEEFRRVKQLINSQKNENILGEISALYVEKAINNLEGVLTLKESLSVPLNLDKITNNALLKLSFYESDFNGSPVGYNAQLASRILEILDAPSITIEEIANQHLKAGNYEAYYRLKENEELKITINFKEEGEDEFQQKIEFLIRNVKTEIERGCALGYIMNGKRLSLISYVDEIAKSIENSQKYINFPLIKSQLDSVNQQITSYREKLIKENEKLIPDNINKKEKERLFFCLKSGNILIFNELIERIKKDQFISFEEQNNVFINYFQQFLSQAKNGDIELIKNSIKKKKNYCGLDFSSLTEHQLEDAEEMLNHWFYLKISTNLANDESRIGLKLLLESIGFKSPVWHETNVYSKTFYLDFNCIPITGKDKTPIPQFGSAAHGKYRLICIREKMIEEELIEEIKELTPVTNRIPIVFYFSWMHQTNWIELANLSKIKRRTFLFFDESMLVYLCGIKESKFPVFIKLTSPIIYAEPYQTASSNLPEEMFYGRTNQIMKLKNNIGDFSCLIYGGRQLGKTVLQREVERIFHNPDKNHFALYVDLRDKGIGFWSKIEQISDVLYECLKIIPDIFPEKQPSNYGLQFVLSKLEDWFKSNSERRILLFLDEADEFLKQDIVKEFQHVSQLKGLMEKTDKRFKIIFSGLHNVRRTIKIPNNPLAHFGTPICVGAMLDKEETIAAQNLVRLPLETLGFYFESDDLVLMILSYCNWYPSLIQIFCNSLLQNLYDKRNIKSLPVIITEIDVTNAYERSRNHIKEKFHLTLSLDERYDLLANIIAGETYEKYLIQSEGMSIDEITTYATLSWPSGFDSTNPKIEVKNLLEEMVDLGVLRNVKDGRFAMRTPNLMGLVGDEKQITENLNRVDRNLPQKFNREVSRIGYKKFNREVRSPFPAIYYDEILDTTNKVILFKGSKAGGLEYVEEFLSTRKKDLQLIIPDVTMLESFEDEGLWKFIEKKRISGIVNIIFFSQKISYSLNDVITFQEKIGKKEQLGAIFLMTPEMVWTTLTNDNKAFVKLENQKIKVFNIPQWKSEIAKEWFRETECSSADITEIFTSIGNWHLLLDHYHSKIIKNPELWKEELEAFSNEIIKDKNTLMQNLGIKDDHFVEVLNELNVMNGDLTNQEFIADKKSSSTPFAGENYLDYFLSFNLIDNELKVNSLVQKILENE